MKPKRAVLDTNVLVHAYFTDAREHEVAMKILKSLDVWLIPFIAVVELFWFGRGAGLDVKGLRNLIFTYLLDKKAKLLQNDIDDLLDSLTCQDPLEWEDELILTVAEREGVPLATFDSGMREKARERGISTIP